MAQGELLFEVRAEEIPARMLEPAVRQLGTRVFEELMTRGAGPAEVVTAFTPRRLVLILKGLPEREPDREEEVVGPPIKVAYGEDGAPTAALQGFLRRLELTAEQVERKVTDKGEYVVARRVLPGRPMEEVLAGLLPRILAELAWPKTMRWGTGVGPWVRPLHGLVALLDGRVVPFSFLGVETGCETTGHAVLSPEPFAVDGPDDYLARLSALGVEVLPARRRDVLTRGMAVRAKAHGGQLVEDPELLDKLTAICEVPGVLEGSFDDGYVELPREVLTTALRDHQSALTVEKDGRLLPVFLTVMDRPDDPHGRVRAGNEWVVEARLADARFFHQEDRKRKLAERARQLSGLAFHERLGSYAEKAERIARLAELIAKELGQEELVPAAVEAAQLLKADLTTQMVVEFTSLQGVVGGLYARAEGYPVEVWQALYDQYLPVSTDDPLPRGTLGRILSVADRLDTLVGMFGLGLVPTGSRDPFGLRRSAQGLVRICLHGELPLDLDLVAARAGRLYGDRLPRSGAEILDDLRPFLADRIRFLLGLRGYAYDEIEAALAVGGQHLPDLSARVKALHEARQEEQFLSVVLSAKRIANIVKGAPEHTLKEDALVEPAEQELYRAWSALRAEVEAAVAAADYPRGLGKIAELAPVLDRFFDEVLVMDENERLRHNRIALLQALHRSIGKIARLTEVVVDKSEHRARFAVEAS
jgi:glycyl-tRNA synthetase beta chain